MYIVAQPVNVTSLVQMEETKQLEFSNSITGILNIITHVMPILRLCSVLLTKYHSGDQVKKMGRTCGMYGGEERCIQGFSGETCRKEITWKTQA
jgi:hypothetical protein